MLNPRRRRTPPRVWLRRDRAAPARVDRHDDPIQDAGRVDRGGRPAALRSARHHTGGGLVIHARPWVDPGAPRFRLGKAQVSRPPSTSPRVGRPSGVLAARGSWQPSTAETRRSWRRLEASLQAGAPGGHSSFDRGRHTRPQTLIESSGGRAQERHVGSLRVLKSVRCNNRQLE